MGEERQLEVEDSPVAAELVEEELLVEESEELLDESVEDESLADCVESEPPLVVLTRESLR